MGRGRLKREVIYVYLCLILLLDGRNQHNIVKSNYPIKKNITTLHGLRSTIMKVSYHTIVMVIMMINGMVLGTFLVIYIYKLLKFLCIVILFKLIKSL